MKRTAIACAAGVAAVAALLLWPSYGRWLAPTGAGRQMCVGGHCCCRLSRASARGEALAGEFPPLDPKQFVGEIRKAYEDAGKHPELFVQLHCYCGCDKTDGHKSLLDCYRDYHGATCQICTDEALQASQMYEQGSPVAQIQDALRRRFGGGK
jgi:Protein of unknown function with PCYCGC motif